MISTITIQLTFAQTFGVAFAGVVLGILIGTLTCREIKNADTDRDASEDKTL